MEAKFFSGLYEGDCANGAKLGMGLTGGDFWSRIGGCENLYRGADQYSVNFSRIVATGDIGQVLLSVPAVEEHSAGARYLYMLRRCNGCGDELGSFNAAVEVGFDLFGDLQPAKCNRVFSTAARVIGGNICELLWYYCPLGQGDRPAYFNVYFDNGTGIIDYDTVYATLDYTGPNFYRFEVPLHGAGKYLFTVRAVTVDKFEDGMCGTVTVEVGAAAGSGVDIVSVNVV